MISIGGWNAPLPDTAHTGREYYAAFDKWNREVAARDGWKGFDGIDWDVEGDDTGKKNVFTQQQMQLIGEMSIAAKQGRYYVSMAPAQSYLDVEEARFDLDVTHAPVWKREFKYHGRNLYAFWLVFYGEAEVEGEKIQTFDWISVQFYEGWSRMGYELASGVDFKEYMTDVVEKMERGWEVHFGERGRKVVQVPREKLVIGIANGWASAYPPVDKFVLVMPDEIRNWWDSRIAGTMFWTIAEEGKEVGGEKLFMAKELAAILHGKAQDDTTESCAAQP